MAGVVIEVLAADVVLALRGDGVGRAADLRDQLARVAGPRAQEAGLDQRRVDLERGLGATDGVVRVLQVGDKLVNGFVVSQRNSR